MEKIIEFVSSRIRELRKRRRLSQEELADMAKIHTAHLGRIERGEENPTLGTIEKIINALDVSVEEFFCFSNNSKDDFSVNKIVAYLNGMTVEEREVLYKTVRIMDKWRTRY